MRPGQITPTELETAILERIAKEHPTLASLLGQLHLLSREFTGAGCYTTFAAIQPTPDLPDGYLSTEALVMVSGLSNSLGAVLACEAGCPKCLEIYTYGDELWDGDSDGFTIE